MKRKAWFGLCVLLLGLVPLLTGASDGRSYVTGYYALELDGVVVGWLNSAEGGNAKGLVINESVGPDYLVKKHIGNVKYEDITVTFGPDVAKAVQEWITNTLEMKSTRKNGAIIAADYNYREISRREFTGALITEIGMPALDASSKDAAKMTIKMSPEYTRYKKGSGKPVQAPLSTKQKKWLPANFRLKIDGLERSVSRVNKIEALVIKQKVSQDAVGEERDYYPEPHFLEIPNLVITFPESDAEPFLDYFEDFVIRGNSDTEHERNGTLEYLAPDMKTVLFTVEFKHLGVFGFEPQPIAAEAGIRRMKAEMYCEEMRLHFGAMPTL